MNKRINVFYTSHARKDLQKLEKIISKKIVCAIEKNTASNPLIKTKLLRGLFQRLYRYRVGDYRIIFEYN